jgi:hypothetical protein
MWKDSPLVPLMKDCWATDPTQRPSFRVVVDRLEAIPIPTPKGSVIASPSAPPAATPGDGFFLREST